MLIHAGNGRWLLLFGFFGLVIIGLFWWSIALIPGQLKQTPSGNIACSQEARICPDGSTVSRTGQNCEFSECPETEMKENRSARPTNTSMNNNSYTDANQPINTSRADDCRITGCSRQLCSDREVTTDCQLKLEYTCYATATCERQPSGMCEWTMTDTLQQCLSRLSSG